MFLQTLVLVLTLWSGPVDSAPRIVMPKQFLRCYKNDTKINVCLQDAIQKAIPVLVKGIPKVGVLPIDPLFTTRATMEQRFGPVNILVDLQNSSTSGLGVVKIVKVRSDVEKYKMEIDVTCKKAIMKGKYFVDGTILGLSLKGDGRYAFTLEDVTATLKLLGEKQLRSGQRHMNMKKFDIILNPKKIGYKLENLFGGNQVLGDYANMFLNSYNQEVYEAMRGTVQDTIGLIFKEVARRFYDKVPYDQIYK